MRLFRVARYGNEQEGPDGDDTNFLVHAGNVAEAAELVDDRLKLLPHGKNIEAFCNLVIKLGSSMCISRERHIIMGPSYEPCIRYSGQKSWYRADIGKEWSIENA